MESKKDILKQIDKLRIDQYELLGRGWQAWAESLSTETFRAYYIEVMECAITLGYSPLEHEQVDTSIALKNEEVLVYSLLVGRKAYELRALRATEYPNNPNTREYFLTLLEMSRQAVAENEQKG